MKRLFIIKRLDRGGAETYLLRFLKYLKAPTENFVLVASGAKGTLDKEYTLYSQLIYEMDFYSHPISSSFRFLRLLKEESFACVCDFRGNFSAWVIWLSKIVRIPKRIVFYRESKNKFNPSFLRTSYANFLTWLTERSATKILANSYAALDHFHPSHKYTPDHFGVIHNGFDKSFLSDRTSESVRQSLHLPASAFVIGHAGRLVSAKNHEMIIRCAIEMCKRHYDVYWIMAGRNVDLKYQDIVTRSNLESRILLLGERDDVLDLMKAMNLFYFPSITEGQPNALIEAMCSGVPYVASDIPPIKETAIAGYGILVPPLDYEHNIRALEEMYNRRTTIFLELRDRALWEFDAQKLYNQFLDNL